MKMSTLAWTGALCCTLLVGGATAQQLSQPLSVRPIGFNYNNFQETSPSDVAVPATPAANPATPAARPAMFAPSCGCAASAPSCGAAGCGGCASAAPCCNSGCGDCDGCGGCGGGCGLRLCDCDLGEPWTLSGFLHGDCKPAITIGGWTQLGYHSESNDLFNDRPDKLNLQQAWLYAEKLAEEGSPFGFRFDIMYGIDGTDTQAFGNNSGEWDFENGFDHGAYSWALPQLYGEMILGEWNIKAGHFFTLVGYEVVPAPNNFFYSHAMTMYNSEPFTHTGVVGTRSITDSLQMYAGWTLGWDTGFDQFDQGSNWLGGFSYTISEDASLTYISTAGNIGSRGRDAYSHSVVLDMNLTENFNWVVQSDMVRVDSTGEDNVGLNQYLLYTVNDCLGLGTRIEWWKGDVLTGYAPHGAVLPAAGSLSYYEATFGANYRPTANVVLRPEVRIDWSPAADYDNTYFAIDGIFTF